MAGKRKPQRTCLGCRESFDQGRLVRFVLDPTGCLLVDYRHKLPGRGAYCCVSSNCLNKAGEKGAFARAFKTPALKVDSVALPQMVLEQVVLKIESLLGMARKSGQTVAGSNLVMSELQRRGDISLVLLAADISTGIEKKIRGYSQENIFHQFSWLTKERLGELLGRAERSVLALRSGPIAETMLQELSRYDQIAGDC